MNVRSNITLECKGKAEAVRGRAAPADAKATHTGELSENIVQLSSLLKAKLLDLTVDAAFVCDDTFHFFYINHAAEQLTGYCSGELIGRSVDTLIPPHLRANHRGQMSSFGADGVFAKGMQDRRPIQCQHKDGRLIQVSGTVTAIPTEGQVFYGVLLHDQTEYEALLKTVEKKQRELAIALEQAKCAISARTHFLGKASHELRTPLNAILGFSQILQQAEELPAEQCVRDYCSIIHQSGEHLLKIVNQILEFSELSSDHTGLLLQNTPLGQMLESVFSVFIDPAEEQGVHLDLKHGCEFDVRADYPRLRHAISNIVDNAVRYTEAGGKVTISHDHDRHGNPRITVADTGAGIPKEHLSTITSPFEQGQNDSQRTADGIGLGLSTSKAVVAMHGGRLRIRSKLSEGTTVTITLPTAANHGETNQQSRDKRLSKDDVFYI